MMFKCWSSFWRVPKLKMLHYFINLVFSSVNQLSFFNIFRLISLNERVWLSEGNELHLIEAGAVLMDCIVSNSVPLSAHHRRRIIIKCQDLVSSSLNALYTKPDTEELVKVLKGTQTRLERMEWEDSLKNDNWLLLVFVSEIHVNF